jgi:hypothetical protein
MHKPDMLSTSWVFVRLSDLSGPSGIWRPEIEERSDGDDDSKTDQRAA